MFGLSGLEDPCCWSLAFPAQLKVQAWESSVDQLEGVGVGGGCKSGQNCAIVECYERGFRGLQTTLCHHIHVSEVLPVQPSIAPHLPTCC